MRTFVLATLAILCAACSTGGSGPDMAQASSTSSSQSSPPSKLAFAACMRSHGIANFPDSDVMQPGGGIDPNSRQFLAAQLACRSLEPQGGPEGQQSAAFQAALVRFSACMRFHAVPGFPDPGGVRPSGPVTTIFGIALPSRIDPQSPQFQAAVKACQPLLPGGPPKGPPKTSWGGAP
jgi:hypothetical protein